MSWQMAKQQSQEQQMRKHKRHLFVDDSIQRIFQLGEEWLEETEVPGEFDKTRTMFS